jgi:hypothetical protein
MALATSVSAPKASRVAGQEVEVFVEAQLSPPTLAIVSGAHRNRAQPAAKVLGYRVVVIDPRRAFEPRSLPRQMSFEPVADKALRKKD